VAGTIKERVSRHAPKRHPSAHARFALTAFRQLNRFYAHHTELGDALGMSRESVRKWKRRPPLRPRSEVRDRVIRLLSLCSEARPYMEHPHDVGRWTTAPNPRLHGETPAQLLLTDGDDGLDRVVSELVDLTPRQKTADINLPTGEELRAALSQGVGDEVLAEVEEMMGDTAVATTAS
jgi:antitoxin Xre/MbcA/ParS-like protein